MSGYSRPTLMCSCMIRQRSSRPRRYHSRVLTNGIDEEVAGVRGADLEAGLVGVLRRLRHRQVGVGLRAPLHQPALGEHDVELVDALEVRGLGEQQQVAVAAGADGGEGAQQALGGEVLAGGQELALVLGPLGVGQAAPGRIHGEERVLDEMALGHGRDRIGAPLGSREGFGCPNRNRGSGRLRCGDEGRPRLPVLVDVSGRRDAAHRGPGGRAARRRPRRARARAVRPRRPPHGLGAPRRAAAGAPRPRVAGAAGPTLGLGRRTAPSPTSPGRRRAIARLRRELRAGRFDVVHVHEPVAPVVGWDALTSADAPVVGTFHCYSERARAAHGGRRCMGARRKLNHLAAADRRLRRRRVDRPPLLRRRLPDHPQRRRASRPAACPRRAHGPRASRCASPSSARPSSARACRCCCAPSRRCAPRSPPSS